MRPPIDNSVMLITGASSGIGAEIARQIAGRVKAMILVARRLDRLEKLRDEILSKHPNIPVKAISCDLKDLTAADALITDIEKEFGTVDVLINNAGFGRFEYYGLGRWQKTEEMIALNVRATAYLVHRTMRGMVEKNRGGILNISSLVGIIPMPAASAYTGTKHFILGFSEALRLEMKGCGIAVSTICPGPVATEFWRVAAWNLFRKLPASAMVSAERCARESIRAFEKGKSVHVVGYLSWVQALMMKVLPRSIAHIIITNFFRAVARLAKFKSFY